MVNCQVQADCIALAADAADDTEGVATPLAIYCPVYIAFAGIAASAAAVVIYFAGVPSRFDLGGLPRSALTHRLIEPSSQLPNAPGFITLREP